MPYRIVFTMLIVFGAAVPLELVWNIADITNLLMALPNLLALVLLAGLANRLKQEYFKTRASQLISPGHEKKL